MLSEHLFDRDARKIEHLFSQKKLKIFKKLLTNQIIYVIIYIKNQKKVKTVRFFKKNNKKENYKMYRVTHRDLDIKKNIYQRN